MLNAIKKARLLAGLTQRELADAVGVTAITVSKWENNVMFPNVKRLKTVADALGTTVEVLIDDKEVS